MSICGIQVSIINIAQIATGFAAVAALFLTIVSNSRTNDVSRSQFWLGLREQFSEERRFEVHKTIRGNLTITNWPEVDDYLGLFEVCEIMLRKKTIDLDDFKTLYQYRLINIIYHDEVIFYKLVLEIRNWYLLYDLLCRVFPHARKNIMTLKNLVNEIVGKYTKIYGYDSQIIHDRMSHEDRDKLLAEVKEVRNKISI